MPVIETRLLTADDLLRLHRQGRRGELIRGVLHETMSTGHEHGKIVMRLGATLFNFVEPRRLGTVVGSDTGVRLERDPDTVREPNIAYTSAKKIPLDAQVPGYAESVPDLVVEVRSPGDSRREVHDKARMWLSHGVRLVRVVHSDTRTVDVHRPNRAITQLSGDDNIDGDDVLPGFMCTLTRVFGP